LIGEASWGGGYDTTIGRADDERVAVRIGGIGGGQFRRQIEAWRAGRVEGHLARQVGGAQP
jgi:hypothetical protein